MKDWWIIAVLVVWALVVLVLVLRPYGEPEELEPRPVPPRRPSDLQELEPVPVTVTERRVLRAIQFGHMQGKDALTLSEVIVRSEGLGVRPLEFRLALTSLQTKGLIEEGTDRKISLTDSGLALV